MLTFLATPHGAGVRLWGSCEELYEIYEVLDKFWEPEENRNPLRYELDTLIGSFAYDIRKAFTGCRTIAKKHPVTGEEGEWFAVEITWTHVVFYFAVLRHNMSYFPYSEMELKAVNDLQESLYACMDKFCPRYSKSMKPFIEGAIYCGNEYLMAYMEDINYSHLSWLRYGTPKDGFRYLATQLMYHTIYDTYPYRTMLSRLKASAKKLNCGINDLRFDYENDPVFDFKW